MAAKGANKTKRDLLASRRVDDGRKTKPTLLKYSVCPSFAIHELVVEISVMMIENREPRTTDGIMAVELPYYESIVLSEPPAS